MQRGASQPGAVETTIAPYTNRTTLLLAGGVTLIVVNFFTSATSTGVSSSLGFQTGKIATGGPVTVIDAVLQFAGLGALLLIASVSDDGGSFALLFLVALWLLWIVVHRDLFALIASWAAIPTGSSGSSVSGGKIKG